VSYERIERIDRTPGVDRITGVVPLSRVGRRENPAEDQQHSGQGRSRQDEPEQPEDDGRPHIDVTV
jgi:hypothetical protein